MKSIRTRAAYNLGFALVRNARYSIRLWAAIICLPEHFSDYVKIWKASRSYRPRFSFQ